jgi:C-terminal processing protease CtpA/Prc
MECSNIQISASIMKILKEHVGEIYCVELVKKENTGFGFLLRQSDDMPFFTVWEIVKNGSAEKNGKIKKGDIILKVNEHDLTMVTYEKGLEILKSIKAGQNAQFTLLSVNQQRFDKTNGIISPLQKIKRKFIRYTSGTSTGNLIYHYFSTY